MDTRLSESLKRKANAYKNFEQTVPLIIGKKAERFFFDSFQKHGWTDTSFEAWQARKRNVWRKKGGGKVTNALMVKSGTLKAAVGTSLQPGPTMNSIKFKVALPYAKIHNDGGIINKAAGGGTLHYRGKDGKLRLTKITTEEGQRKVTQVRHYTYGKHVIQMPRRRFMGNSQVLIKELREMIIVEQNKVNKA